ncbi:OmpA family protein [Aurantivibrio plasticivorans]
MKKLIVASTLAATATVTTPYAFAGEAATAWKQAGVFSTSTILGAAAGGPVGMLLGAIGGAYLGEKVKAADLAELTDLELAEKELLVTELRQQLTMADGEIERLNQTTIDGLSLQVLFHTGADQLTQRGENRLGALASFLAKHPSLSVRLTGHADPRGTDEYNNVLSEHRALTVQQTLEQAGIASYRIERSSHGSLKSLAPKGDYEAYAMERRVDVEIFDPRFELNPQHAEISEENIYSDDLTYIR